LLLPSKTQPDSYLPELDGVRATSILLVLAAHMLPLGPKSLALNSAAGLMGMSLFFCLSGFLITRFLYRTQSVPIFLLRRLARIVPLVFVYSLITALLIEGRWDSFFAIDFFFLNYMDSSQIPESGHLWSLCVEMHFYLVSGLLVAILGRRAFWFVPLALGAVFVARYENQAFESIRTHLRVDEILAGAMLALIWMNQDHFASRWIIGAFRKGFWIAVTLWFLSSHSSTGELMLLRPYFAMALVGCILFEPDGWRRRICRKKPLRYIADISYALYIWHPLTYIGWMNEGSIWERYLLKRPVSFALTIALAHLSTFYLEKPVVRWAREKTTRKLTHDNESDWHKDEKPRSTQNSSN
jgi:peptidoglycan/LPS O-acetylase OafA/YrhL